MTTSPISQNNNTIVTQQNQTTWRDRVVTKFNEGMGPLNLDGLTGAIRCFLIALPTIVATIAAGLASGSIASAAIAGGIALSISGLFVLFACGYRD